MIGKTEMDLMVDLVGPEIRLKVALGVSSKKNFHLNPSTKS